jgi:hypothetical protein
MKYLHFIFAGIFCMAIAACGSGTQTESGTEGTTPTANGTPGKAPNDPHVGQQIPAQEVLGSTTERILRYQPADEVAGYINSPEDMDMYIHKLSGAMRRQIGKLTPETPTYGTVVIGVNPQGEHRLWYVFPESTPSAAFKAAMEAAVAEEPVLKVKQEVVVFGVAMTLWGFKESHEQAGRVILPQEWQDAGKAFSTPQKATKLAELAWGKAS